jgi:hypothetical protein
MVVYWLMMIVINPSTTTLSVTHVGNFSSYTDCDKFAVGYTTPVPGKWPPGVAPAPPIIEMVCVQANEADVNPPPG